MGLIKQQIDTGVAHSIEKFNRTQIMLKGSRFQVLTQINKLYKPYELYILNKSNKPYETSRKDAKVFKEIVK